MRQLLTSFKNQRQAESYFFASWVLSLMVASTTLLVTWAYSISRYGFLIGFGIGWLPASVLAAIAYGIVWLVMYGFWLISSGAWTMSRRLPK